MASRAIPVSRQAPSKRLPARVGFYLAAAAISLLSAIVANAGQALALAGMPGGGPASNLELSVFEGRIGRERLPIAPEILVIGIEARTAPRLHPEHAVLPLPRADHARLIRGLRDAGAHSVVLDLTFADRSPRQDDEALRSALRDSAPLGVTLAVDYDPARSHADPDAPTGWVYWFRPRVVLPSPLPQNVQTASAIAFDAGRDLAGAVLLRPDARTGALIPHVALSAALARYHQPLSSARWDQHRDLVRAGPFAWPVGVDGELLTRWSDGKQGFLYAEYSSALDLLRSGPGREQFRDTIVIVGDMTGTDRHPTPVGPLLGTQFVAETLNTLLSPSLISIERWTMPQNALWCWLLGFVSALSVRSPHIWTALSGIAGTLFFAFAVPELALRQAHLWIDTAGPLGAVLIAASLAFAWEGLRLGWLARRYVTRILGSGDVRTRTEEASVMFADLRGSTAISEQLGPARVGELLAELVEQLSRIVVAEGGQVERTLGDGLMAVFRFENGPAHASQCVQACVRLQDAVEGARAQYSTRYGVSIRITIGAEAGIVSSRLLDTGERQERSSSGPTVNLAARLQAACADMDREILIGPTLRSLTRHEFPATSVGPLELKGIQDATIVFAVSGGTAAGENP